MAKAWDDAVICDSHPLTVAGWFTKRMMAVAGLYRSPPADLAARLAKHA